MISTMLCGMHGGATWEEKQLCHEPFQFIGDGTSFHSAERNWIVTHI